MLSHKVVQVRGTPASGKSVLLELVNAFIAQKHSTLSTVKIYFWPQEMTPDGSVSYIEKIMGGELANLQCGHADKVLLLDEAQSSYYDLIFWNSLLKQASCGTGIHVLLFSSYGAPMDCPVVTGFVTPMILGRSQIIGLTWESDGLTGAAGLLLQDGEAEDLCQRHTAASTPPFSLSSSAVKWIQGVTQGHVGAYTAILNVISSNEVSYLHCEQAPCLCWLTLIDLTTTGSEGTWGGFVR
jgi:hypothetical protein